MPEIIKRMNRMILELECYCKGRFKDENVLAELDALQRLKAAKAILVA